MFRRPPRIEIKTPAQIRKMRAAGLLVGRTLELLRGRVAPGMSTRDLDRLAEENIRAAGGVPSFLGYQPYPGAPPFPATICASVNDEVVHGIPGERRLRTGDILSIDCGAVLEGWHGDAAITVPVGEVDESLLELIRVTEDALWRGLAAAALGGRVGDISSAVEAAVRSAGSYGIVEDLTGHGIGSAMHQPPLVPNHGSRGGDRNVILTDGLVLAVEPMVAMGTHEVSERDDGWTIVTEDGRYAAHAEHTFTVTPAGTWVLTALDGGRERLADLGVVTAPESYEAATGG